MIDKIIDKNPQQETNRFFYQLKNSLHLDVSERDLFFVYFEVKRYHKTIRIKQFLKIFIMKYYAYAFKEINFLEKIITINYLLLNNTLIMSFRLLKNLSIKFQE